MADTLSGAGAPGGAIEGRQAWLQALREGLFDPGAGFSMYSDGFDGWPLGEPEVVRALREWALPRRRGCARMLARSYAGLMREAPRFVQWRLDFGHVIECRELPPDIAAPSEGLWLRERGVLALPAQRERRAVHVQQAAWQASLQAFEQAWDLAEPGFVPVALGL